MDILELRNNFKNEQQELFNSTLIKENGFDFSVRLSLLVEEYILKVVANKKFDFSVVATGGFSRRELSPHSDIDLMFILPTEEQSSSDLITDIITSLWDCGIEVSHTIRTMSDPEKFIEEDLHSFTQFFETRFLFGSKKLYNSWNKNLFTVLDEEKKVTLINQYFQDMIQRQNKYGDSPKVLEPNIKYTSGGLRDLQSVEWMYSIKNNTLLTNEEERTQTQIFLRLLKNEGVISEKEHKRIKQSYEFILRTRNLLHFTSGRRNDRLDFTYQETIARLLQYNRKEWMNFMKRYFEASSLIHRFSRTMIKKYEEDITQPLSDYLTIQLDDDFFLKGNKLITNRKRLLSMSSMLRAFYYRGLHDALFDRSLRALISESVNSLEDDESSSNYPSVFFREILNLPHNVGATLASMNELGVLGIILPEFNELIGFYQPGVYHCYTADEHTLIALKNLEQLNESDSELATIYKSVERKDLLFLAVLLHDIGKPVSVSGHEIIGAEIANSVCSRLGYTPEDNRLVQFLVEHHLTMEQVAFRRNLNDPNTLNNFAEIFYTRRALRMLFLLTYADLSAVSPTIWTQWKSDLLFELYTKTHEMLEKKVNAEILLNAEIQETTVNAKLNGNKNVNEHIKSIDDLSYFSFFTEDEIKKHADTILANKDHSVLINEINNFTNITVITKDSSSLLSRLCGAISINDLDIHDARIFTRSDGYAIDTFNVTEFRSHKVVPREKYSKIEESIKLALEHQLQIINEFKKIRSRWKLLEQKVFGRTPKIKVEFEDHPNFTIIDIFSPDRLGLLYTITKTFDELELNTYFAKISTQGDNIVDSFYLLNRDGTKINEANYELVRVVITEAIERIL